jgi:hypothetical protein
MRLWQRDLVDALRGVVTLHLRKLPSEFVGFRTGTSKLPNLMAKSIVP